MLSRIRGRHLVLAAGVMLGVLAPAHVAAADDTDRSLIVTQGTGEVRVRPDSVRVDVGVTAQARTLDEARTQVNTAMTRVLAALHRLDLGNLTVESRQISFNPLYTTPNDGRPPAISGFSATNHVLCTLQKAPETELAERGARIVDAALDAGANDVGSVEFFLADQTAAENEALSEAVRNAEADARIMAQAAHVTLVGPVWIEEASPARFPRAMALAVATVATPIEAGEITIQSSVTAKYTFR